MSVYPAAWIISKPQSLTVQMNNKQYLTVVVLSLSSAQLVLVSSLD